MTAEHADPNADFDPDKLLGEILANRYQIESRLGEGAMGAVYRARHVKVGRPFAVKVLHARLIEDKKVLQRFEREAELAGRLRHPNVIGVVDVGELPEGTRYMVMDFAEGPDLAALLSEAPMAPQRVMSLTRQMLEGLFHAHEQGLIHRDFKPENVIVERDSHNAEVPRIVDFGIAILREGGESANAKGRLTTNGLVLGTPHYMAPEQAVADPIDHRIDLFALGIIVYEMLCGKLPFDGTGAEVARANLLLDPPPISQRVPYLEVDPLLEAFARKLMAKKRDLRPATAKVAREILDLIEKDRMAAAAALGVPPDVVRTPITTQQSTPVTAAAAEDVDPYAAAAVPTVSGRPTPLPMPVATPAPAVLPVPMVTATPPGGTPVIPQSRRDITTDIVGTAPQRRRKWAAVVIGALAATGVVVAMLSATSGGGDGKGDKVAMQVQPEPVKQVEPTPPAPPAPVVAETGSGSGVVTEPVPEVKAGSAAKKIAVRPNIHKTPKTPVVAAVETVKTPEPAKTMDASAFAAQYQRVGEQLKAYEQVKGGDAASDLWTRYRLIRYSDAVSDQAKRDASASILAKIQHDIAARK